jgi:hypothetical protein
MISPGAVAAMQRGLASAAHRYWGLISLSSDGYVIHVTEIEMAAAVGGANLCTGGTAIGSQTGGARPPANAFDGSVASTSFYQEDDNSTWGVMSGSWVGYDFGSPVTIREVRRKSANATPQFVREARVQTLIGSDDGTNWLSYDILRWSAWSQNQTQTAEVNGSGLLPTNEYPFWAINCTKTALGQIQLAELIFANSTGGASIVTGLPPIFGMRGAGTSEGFEARRFLDGNGTASKFVHNTYTPNAWKSGLLGVCFTGSQSPAELRLQAVSDFPTGAPEDFTIRKSHDGLVWTTVATVTGQTGWTTSQVRSFSI